MKCVSALVGIAAVLALGQTIVIDNRGGAFGNIANDIVAKATPDGHTLLITADATITINPSVIIDRLYQESARIMHLPDSKERVLAGGAESAATPPDEARSIVRDETAMWAKVVQIAGVKVE
jgi:tripartite-type tricarboxylate transporter receptor subunit TctC